MIQQPKQSTAPKLRFASHRQVADRAAVRPSDYLRQLERIIVRRDEHGIWFDAGTTAYAELCAKYTPRQPTGANGSANVQHRQSWQEFDGRWIPVGVIPPGIESDPPQFEPAAGETQHTPAFPREEFQ